MKFKKSFIAFLVITLLSLGLTSCDFLMQTAILTFYNDTTLDNHTTIVSNLKLYDSKGHLIQTYSDSLQTGERYSFEAVNLYEDYYFTFDMQTIRGNYHYITDDFYFKDDYIYDLGDHSENGDLYSVAN